MKQVFDQLYGPSPSNENRGGDAFPVNTVRAVAPLPRPNRAKRREAMRKARCR